ncbi:MAG: hypothetical protein EU532_10975 [Promethearchaeota archaeon]|nr:MAG: hypothetical protein EU532_10975 [Candidatus Lokiarchaeota archaeon]
MFSCLVGLFFIYRARKLDADLLLYLGFTYFFAGLIYFGDFLDFITILITGTNVDNSTGFIGIINWMWFPGVILFAMYLGAELMVPNQKKVVLAIYIVLGIIFELVLFLDPAGSITYTNPMVPGEDLINDNMVEDSFMFYLTLFFLLSIILFLGFGFLIRAIQTKGDIRKNFLYLSIGAFVYTIGGILDGLFSPGIILILIRSAMIGSSALFYLGLRGT